MASWMPGNEGAWKTSTPRAPTASPINPAQLFFFYQEPKRFQLNSALEPKRKPNPTQFRHCKRSMAHNESFESYCGACEMATHALLLPLSYVGASSHAFASVAGKASKLQMSGFANVTLVTQPMYLHD